MFTQLQEKPGQKHEYNVLYKSNNPIGRDDGSGLAETHSTLSTCQHSLPISSASTRRVLADDDGYESEEDEANTCCDTCCKNDCEACHICCFPLCVQTCTLCSISQYPSHPHSNMNVPLLSEPEKPLK